MHRIALFGALLLLASCEQMGAQHLQTAQQMLQAFCSLHRAEITHVLLSPDQISAGNTVCGAVGMRLGGD